MDRISLPDVSRQEAVLVTAAVLAAGYGFWSIVAPKSVKLGQPLPQPPTLPVLGNIHMLKQGPLQCFQYWREKLGPIFAFDVGTDHWVVVNRIQNFDLKTFAVAPYGEGWRKRRRIFMDALGTRRVPQYQEYVDSEAKHLLNNVGKTQGQAVDPMPFIQLFTYNVTSKVMVDERFDDPYDPWVIEEMRLVDKAFEYAAPTANPARIFPILKMFPQSWVGARESDVKALTKYRFGRFQQMLDKLQTRLDSGEDVKCFCRDLLDKEDKGELDHEEVLTFITTIILAGNDTTASTLAWWMAEMANHPEIQAKAYAEMTEKHGKGKVPSHEEALQLPYLNATIRETMRLHPAGPLGVPHSVTDDDVFEGYHIPKDSTVMFNVYAMNRDPAKYEQPEVFKPERYLDITQPSSALVNGKPEDRDHTSFGFGRRVCAGMQLAETELLAVISGLVTSYAIEADQPIDVHNFKLRFTMGPMPYKIRFVTRA